MTHETKLPPHDHEAEAALLGGLILSWGKALPEAARIIDASDFYKPAHTAIYEAIERIVANGKDVDIVKLKSALTDAGQFDQVGGVDYLQELCESVPSAASTDHYAERVKRQAQLRSIADHAHKAMRAAMDGHDDPADIADRLQSNLINLHNDENASTGPNIGGDVQAVYDRLANLADGEADIQSLKTNIADLDRMTDGFAPGQLIVLAATTGAGKTAFANQVMAHWSLQLGAAVGVFSLEMTRRQLAERLLTLESGIALDSIRGVHKGQDVDFASLSLSVGRLNDVPIYPIEHRQLNPDKLRASARYLKDRYGIEAIVIDYLQLLKGTRRDTRYAEVSELSREVKLLALELDVPVLCLSQLNRDSVRDNRRPRLCDLRDSGSIEQDADVVLFLHDPNRQTESPTPGYSPDEKDIELIVAKQRQGPTGAVQLRFDGARQRFRNLQLVGNTEIPA